MKIHVYTDNDLYATSLSEKVIKSFLSRAPEFSGIIIVLDVIKVIFSLF
jgi:hypothetical protein